MAKPRGLYTPVYASLPRHPKVRAAAAALGCDRVKLVGHLVCFWTWCLESSGAAALTADDVALGAEWPPRKAHPFAETLADVGLLERIDGGYAVHEWEEYGGKVAGIQQADRERHAQSKTQSPRRTSAEVPQNFHGNSSLDETRRDETREDEKKPEDPKPQSARKRATRLPVDEPFIAELVQEFTSTFTERKVRDEVERALNHVSSRKWLDQRRGVRDWLKREAGYQAERTPSRPAYLQAVPAGESRIATPAEVAEFEELQRRKRAIREGVPG